MTTKKRLTMHEVLDAARATRRLICTSCRVSLPSPYYIYGIPRGGVSAALALNAVSFHYTRIVDNPEAADVILDDLVDSGRTMQQYMTTYPGKVYATLFAKKSMSGVCSGVEADPDTWLVFPWEGGDDTTTDDQSADDIPTRLLQYIGEDVTRGGLIETPQRFLKAWRHWSSGYKQDPRDVLKTFDDGAQQYDEMVLVRDIPVYSHCEHHLAPFFGRAHVAYIPQGKIVGLSKLTRVVDILSRRLQVQERLTTQVVDAINETLEPKGVACVIECRHLCMESRGVKRQGETTVTSAMRGAFLQQSTARVELFSLINRR